MKTYPIAVAEDYSAPTTTTAMLWRLVRTDGAVFAFTSHDADLEFGGLLYRTTSGFDESAVASKADMSVDNLEVLGVLDEVGIEAEDIEAGRWDYARVELRRVNWRAPARGAELVRFGTLGKADRKNGQYVIELRGLMQALQVQIGSIVTPDCQATFGDAKCLYPLETLRQNGAVVSAESRRVFVADGLVPSLFAFEDGDVTFDPGGAGGLNEAIRIEIRSLTFDSDGLATIELQLPLPYLPTLGDTFSTVPGCPRTKAACLERDNLLHFRGFSFVPGENAALRIGGQ